MRCHTHTPLAVSLPNTHTHTWTHMDTQPIRNDADRWPPALIHALDVLRVYIYIYIYIYMYTSTAEWNTPYPPPACMVLYGMLGEFRDAPWKIYSRVGKKSWFIGQFVVAVSCYSRVDEIRCFFLSFFLSFFFFYIWFVIIDSFCTFTHNVNASYIY